VLLKLRTIIILCFSAAQTSCDINNHSTHILLHVNNKIYNVVTEKNHNSVVFKNNKMPFASITGIITNEG